MTPPADAPLTTRLREASAGITNLVEYGDDTEPTCPTNGDLIILLREAADTLEAHEREIAALGARLSKWTDSATGVIPCGCAVECDRFGPDKLIITDELPECHHHAELRATLVTRTQERDEARTPLSECYACQRCGRRDGLDAVITDDEWKVLAQDRWTILCLWCLDALALEAGVSHGVSLYFAGRALHGIQDHATVDAMMIAVRSARAESEAKVAALTADLAQAREALTAVVAMYGPSTDYDFKAKAVWEQAEAALSLSQEPR